MNARMLTKAAILFFGFLFLVSLGVKAGRWAEAASQQTENRYADAIRVLQDK